MRYNLLMKERIIYAGTYTGKKSEGIYRFSFNGGESGKAELFCRIDNPKYLCRYKDMIVAVCDFENGSGTALIDRNGKMIDRAVFEKQTSCYVACKDDLIYTANYHAGTVSKLKIVNDRFEFIRTELIREKAGCHQILFHKDRILVPCLFLDKVIIFDEDLDRIGEIIFSEGSGPRHGLFSDDQKYLYLVSELSNELFVIDMDKDEIVSQTALLDKTHVEGTAAIRKKDGHLYVSTRGEDVISVVGLKDLKLKEVKDCGGKHPRDFIIVGDCLLCANRFSDSVTVFRISEDGILSEKTSETCVPEAVCLIE